MADQIKFNKLHSKRVLVIGGTSGIGLAVAEASIEAGATVIVSSSNSSRVQSVVAKLQSTYPSRKAQIAGVVCNLGDDASLEANLVSLLNSSTENGSKKLDHVAFTAADSLAVTTLKDFDLKKMHDAGRIRFFAPLLLGKHLPDFITPGRESSYTLTTGTVADRPNPNWSVIGAYAAGIPGIGRGLALDLAPLRVNCVSPGLVNTALWASMPEDDKAALFKHVAGNLPTKTIAEPEDVAEAYVYLMRDHNVSGSVISTNGGYLLK